MAFALLGVLGVTAGLWAQNTTSPGSAATIAIVNSEPVTQADLERVRDGNADTPVGSLLVELIDERVLAQRGRTLGYTFGEQQFEVILENVKRQNSITSDEQLDTALEQSHLTKAQLRSNWERTAIAARVLGTEGQAYVSDEDARRYFDSHRDEFPLQTFDTAKPDVLARLTADRTTHNLVFTSYLRSLRNGATIVWTEPGLQQAYEQAAR